MPTDPAYRKSRKTTTYSPDQARQAINQIKRHNRPYHPPLVYTKALALLRSLGLCPVLIAKSGQHKKNYYISLAFCKDVNGGISVWRTIIYGSQVASADQVVLKDTPRDILIRHTYMPLANALSNLSSLQDPVIAPGILYRRLEYIYTHDNTYKN